MMIEFSKIQGMEKLKKGGQATVYKAPSGALHAQLQEPVAVKKYSKKTLQGNECAIEIYLKMLIENRKNAPEDIRKTIDQHMVWPRVIVYENGEACGFAMNLVPSKFFVSYQDVGGEEKADSNFDFILNDNNTRKSLGLPIINNWGRAKITYDLLLIISQLHKYDFIIGDISPSNIFVYIDPDKQQNSRVLFIDSDSFRKTNHLHPLKQPHTPNWFPPEAWYARQKRIELERNNGDANEIMSYRAKEFIQNTKTDVYKICLAILRLYHEGDQRTSISESPVALRNITRELSKEFAVLINRGLSSSQTSRPTGQELFTCCREIIFSKHKSRQTGELLSIKNI